MPADLENQYVWIETSSRGNGDDVFATNRIALKCENISINTSRQVFSHAVPFSGVKTGESRNISVDMGMSDKNISLSGVITEQDVVKNFDGDSSSTEYSKYLTAHEVAQLMHSYVDSSFAQTNQNFNKLIILIPSRVASDWDYYSASEAGTSGAITENTTVDNCPLIPFTYKTRNKDNYGVLFNAKNEFPSPVISNTGTIENVIQGFVRNFSTTMTGGNPFIEFSLDFQVAEGIF
jgi:hypothetical protein